MSEDDIELREVIAAAVRLDRVTADREIAALRTRAEAAEAKLSEMDRILDDINEASIEVDPRLAGFRRSDTARLIREWTLEECAKVVEATPNYPDTKVGMRQQWVREQAAASIRARSETEGK